MKNWLWKFLIIQKMYSIISLEIIKDVNNKVFTNSDQRLLYSFINPMFGKFFCDSGCLRNLRYYSPEIEPGLNNDIKNFEIRKYSADTCESLIVQSIIYLFPSSNGILTTIENKDTNYTKKIFYSKKKLKKSITKLSSTFVKLLRRKNVCYWINHKKNININLSRFMNFFFLSNIDKDHNILLKLLIMHSYVLNVLDTKYEYKRYLEGIVKRLDNTEKDSVGVLELSDIQKEEFKKLTDNFTEFPYSKVNKPPTGSSIHICYKTKNNYSYDKIRTFSDNTEMVILQICQFLFYDEKLKRYSLDHLKLEKFSPLLNFFEKYSKGIFTITKEIRNDWSIVVQCLEDHPYSYNDYLYGINVIQYSLADVRNEISTGIINILCVLSTICDSKKNCLYQRYNKILKSNHDIEFNIATIIEKMFKLIASPNVNIECVTIGNRIVKKIDSRNELFGDLNIIIKSKVNDIEIKTKFILSVSQSHAKVIFVSRNNSLDNIPSFENLLKIDKKESLMSSLLRQYLILLKNDDSKLETPKSLFNILFIQGPLILNEEIKNYLINLMEYKEKLEVNNIWIPVIDKVYDNVLKSVSLTDENTKNIFEPFYYFDVKDEYKILKIWYLISRDDYDLKYEKLKEIWDLKVSKECNPKKLMLNHSIYSNERASKMISATKFKIEKLYLNRYSAEFSLITILYLLNKNTVLSSLTISYTNWEQVSLEPITKALETNETLTEFKILYCELSVNNLKFIGNLLENNQKLKSLTISNCKMEQDGIIKIFEGLINNKTLSSLDISNNNIGNMSLKTIFTILKNNTGLISLDISNNNIGNEGSEEIAEYLKNNSVLTSLKIKNNFIRLEGIKAIFDSLIDNGHLLSLDISGNNINHDSNVSSYSMDQIFQGLNINQSLMKLDLSNSNLSYDSLNAMAEILGENSKISALILAKNQISCNGTSKIFNSLTKNENLTNLDISNNDIGAESAKEIAKYLRKNKRLVSLNLSKCKISSTSFEIIFDALKENRKLIELNISNNNLKNEDCDKIYEVLDVNKTLLVLNILGNYLEYHNEKYISKIMDQKRAEAYAYS